MSGSVTVISAGWGSTVQDRGRPGRAHLGVPASGAVDPALAATANRLVGNPDDAALIETSGGLIIEADDPVIVASTAEGVPDALERSSRLHLPADRRRVWHYVAVRGGFDAAPELGSRSTDTLSGIGPPPLTAGDRLAVGPDPGTVFGTHHAPLRPLGTRVRIGAGPRLDWFTTDAADLLTTAEWTIATSSRVGVRLSGPVIERLVVDELPSEGLVRGAIQVPPDGQPVMMLADHPTTGGYPVIAVVHPDDVAIVAQTSAGAGVTLRM